MNEDIQELCEFFERLNSVHRKITCPKRSNSFVSQEQTADIKIFDEYILKQGGHTGYWGTKEHNVYLQLNKKHNLINIIYFLRLQFPDISEDEIIQHDKWHKNYIKLKERHQKALKLWKSGKNMNKNKDNMQNNSPANKILTNENIKWKIQKWKESKQKLKESKEHNEKITKFEITKKEEIKKINREIIKMNIMNYKKEKEDSAANLKTAKMTADKEKQKLKAKVANKMLLSYRRKDMEFMQKIRIKKEILLKKKSIKQTHLKTQRIMNTYDRNPLRLLIPTVEWKQKIKYLYTPLQQQNHTSTLMNINNIQHLTIPEWRKEVKSRSLVVH